MILLLLSIATAFAAKTPCDANFSSECMKDWTRVAVQQNADSRSLWSREDKVVLCIEPGPKECAPFTGDVGAFATVAKNNDDQRANEAAHLNAKNTAKPHEGSRLKITGLDLKKQGWKELARCKGHAWSYVVEKKGERKLCSGINARSGPTENACTDFSGDLAQFKSCRQ